MENTTPVPDVNNSNPINLSNIGKNTLYQMNKDMKFVGVFSIIIGIFNCLTIFGAIVGVPMLLAGFRLKDAAENFTSYLYSNSPIHFEMALEKQRSYFFIMKVAIVIAIVAVVLEIAAIIAFFAYFMNYFQSGMMHSV